MSSAPTEPERAIARLRPHARRLFWPCVVLIAAMAAVGYWYGQFPEMWQNLGVLVGGLLLIILAWLIPLLSWLATHYVITSRRVVLRRGFFIRIRQELLHSRGYDVTVRKNALQSLFGSGDVRINTGLDNPVVLKDVPSADLVQSALHDLMEHSNPIAQRRQAAESLPDDETRVWGER